MSPYKHLKMPALARSWWRRLPLPLLVLGSVIALIGPACSEKRELPAIGTRVSRPIDTVYHQGSQHFIVLNSNLNHIYASGSLLLLDRQGTIAKAVEVPRLGRSLSLAGDRLLVTFDRESGDDTKSLIILYSITTPNGAGPELQEHKRWEVDDCTPVGAALRKNSPYFAVSCQSGKLLAGQLVNDDLSQSTLQNVRRYSGAYVRRAIHLDTRHNLLYSFVTDLGHPDYGDKLYTDSKSWDPHSGLKGALTEGANEVPDELEKNALQFRDLKDRGSAYEFMVYDFEAAAKEGFPFKEAKETTGERRWLYFRGEGDPELAEDQKYYRTNFWQALAAPQGDEAAANDTYFYLSHRGLDTKDLKEHANNIIKVTIGDDRNSILDPAVATPDAFTFTKVFGQGPSQRNAENYIGGFALTKFNEGEAFVINSFRDLAYFTSERYALTAAAVNYEDNSGWMTSQASYKAHDSYLQSAVSEPDSQEAAHVLTCSFYGDAIILFKLKWGEDLETVKRID